MNPVAERIKAEINARSVISFARFMELALYCPDYGYYEKESDNLGRRGDFYTSVSVGPLFGELLAFQFAGWLAGSGSTPLQIIETGAHDGRLAADILRWLRTRRPAMFERVEYVINEPSSRRRSWQQEMLGEFTSQVRWQPELASTTSPFNGVVFSNELLDAFPVHRLGWDAKRHRWFEWGVTTAKGEFGWARLESAGVLNGESLAMRQLLDLPDELLAVLPDEFTTEISPQAERWWRQAAAALQGGRLMTLDYGLRTEDFMLPQRSAGTLRAYYQHKLCGDVLANAGQQDITAHVNFSIIQMAGEQAGLRTEFFGRQSDFLAGILQRFWSEAERAGDWSPERKRQLQTLTHPEHLGRAFAVLVQARGGAGGTDAR